MKDGDAAVCKRREHSTFEMAEDKKVKVQQVTHRMLSTASGSFTLLSGVLQSLTDECTWIL